MNTNEMWRRTLGMLAVAQFFAAAAFSVALPFLPLYVQALGVTGAGQAALWAGASSAALSLASAACGPLWSTVARRQGARAAAEYTLLGSALVVGAMGLARNAAQLAGLRLVQGSVAGVQTSLAVLASAVAPRQQLGWSIALLQAATLAGAALGPPAGGLIASHYGYRAAFAVAAALLCAAGLATSATGRQAMAVRRPAARTGMLYALRDPMVLGALRPMIATLLLLQLAATATLPVLPLYVKELSGTPAATTGLLLGLGGLAGAISAQAAGPLGAAVGYRLAVAAAALGAALLSAPQALVVTPGQLLVLRIGLGLFSGALIPSVQALLGQAMPTERRRAALNLAASASLAGSAAGPLAGALIAAAFGLRAVFLATTVLLLLAAALAATMAPSARGAPQALPSSIQPQ